MTEYAAAPGPGALKLREPMMMMDGENPCLRYGIENLRNLCVAVRLMRRWRSQLLSSSSMYSPALKMPAFATMMSMPPYSAATASTAAWNFSLSVMSQTTPLRPSPLRFLVMSGLMSIPTTTAPSAWRRSAVALPIPPQAPVTMATLPRCGLASSSSGWNGLRALVIASASAAAPAASLACWRMLVTVASWFDINLVGLVFVDLGLKLRDAVDGGLHFCDVR